MMTLSKVKQNFSIERSLHNSDTLGGNQLDLFTCSYVVAFLVLY